MTLWKATTPLGSQTHTILNRRGESSSETLTLRASEDGAAHFLYIYMKLIGTIKVSVFVFLACGNISLDKREKALNCKLFAVPNGLEAGVRAFR